MLQNASLIVKIGADTAEDGPRKESANYATSSFSVRHRRGAKDAYPNEYGGVDVRFENAFFDTSLFRRLVLGCISADFHD